MQGYIKLHRQLLEWEWYKNTPVKTLFIHCLLRANHADKKWQGVLIKKGSFITSYENLSIETGLSYKQVRTALDKLKLTGEVAHQTTSQYSIITINNWDKFQIEGIQEGSQRANEGQAEGSQRATNNNDKNDKNVEEVVVEKLYGEYGNVFLTDYNYRKLLGVCLSEKLLREAIDSFSSKIEEGKEQPYNSESPNAHYVRVKKYVDYRLKHPEKFAEEKEYNPYDTEGYNAFA